MITGEQKERRDSMLVGTLYRGNHIAFLGAIFIQQAIIRGKQIKDDEFCSKRPGEERKHMPCDLIEIASRGNSQGKIIQCCQPPQMTCHFCKGNNCFYGWCDLSGHIR